jgi:alpha-L-fucosidase
VYGANPEKNNTQPGENFGKFNIQPGAFRFTVKDNQLYAICFGWPDNGKFIISSVNSDHPVSDRGIASVSMLGNKGNLDWEMTDKGLEVAFPETPPCDDAYVLKIVPKGKLIY